LSEQTKVEKTIEREKAALNKNLERIAWGAVPDYAGWFYVHTP